MIESASRSSDQAIGSGWAPGIIEQLLTRYSRPGDTLLLVPLTDPRRPHQPPRTTPASRRRARPAARIPRQAGHAEAPRPAAGSLTTDPTCHTWLAHLPARAAAAAAGRRLHVLTGNPHPAEADSHTAPGQRPGVAVILSIVEPHQLDRFAQVAWRRLLRPGGILAVLTHSDHDTGRLIDPTTPLIRAARQHGFAWLDHIIITGHPIQPTGKDHTDSRQAVDDTGERPAAAGAVIADRRWDGLRLVDLAATRQRATGPTPTDAPTPIGGHPTRYGHYDLLIFLDAPPPLRRTRTRRGRAR
jgi:hypothetical protein